MKEKLDEIRAHRGTQNRPEASVVMHISVQNSCDGRDAGFIYFAISMTVLMTPDKANFSGNVVAPVPPVRCSESDAARAIHCTQEKHELRVSLQVHHHRRHR